MLSTALPTLQVEIQNSLQQALTQAQMIFTIPSDDSVGSSMTKYQQQLATQYANVAASIAAPLLAKAIHNYVMQIGITAVPKTLAIPGIGPVTGAINITDFKIS